MRKLETHHAEGRRASDTKEQLVTEACRCCTTIRVLGEKQKVLAQHLSAWCLLCA